MITAKRTPRTAALLLGVVAASAGLLLASATPGLLPWAAASNAVAAQSQASASCVVSYDALDPANLSQVNPNKEVPFAVGSPVTQRDEAGIKAELKERRTCGANGKFDTELLATHYADWSDQASDLTSRKVTYAEIDAFRAQLNADPALYSKTLAEVEGLENASAFSLQSTAIGVWSVYVTPNGDGGITTHVGQSSHEGTGATFTHPSGAVVQYRLECGFQIIHEAALPGLPVCDNAECGSSPTPTTPPVTPPVTPPTTPPTCPPGQHGTPPVCKDDPSNDPYVQGNTPVGGGQNADPGPGTYQPVAPPQPPAAPYVPPAAPTAPSAPAPVVVPVTPPSTPQVPVDTGTQTNNGTVPVTGGTNCNPEFQNCP